MQLNLTPRNMAKNINSTNFKGYYKVEVPKSCFENPDDLEACEKEFDKKLFDEVDKQDKRFIKAYFKNCILESDSYKAACKAIKTYGLPGDLSWFKQNTHLPIQEPAKQDFHTFNVYTEKEGKNVEMNYIKVIHSALFGNLHKISKKLSDLYPKNPHLQKAYFVTAAGIEKDKAREKATKGAEPEKTFTIESFEDIKDIAKDIKL